HVPIQGLALGHNVLESLAAGIARLDEDKDSRAASLGHFDKRREAVVAEIGTDCQSVGAPRAGVTRTEISLGISLGRAADVVPLGVENYEQALAGRVGNHRAQRDGACRAKLLEEC